MDSWIPALSTALQHSIQNVIFLSFQIWISGNTWPQCTVKFTSLLFSLLCKNLRVFSVFISATDKVDADSKVQRQKDGGSNEEKMSIFLVLMEASQACVTPNTCGPEIPSAGSEPGNKTNAPRRSGDCHSGTEQSSEGPTFFSWLSKLHQEMTAVLLIDDSDFSLFFRGGGSKACA